jgi:diadenosine tetraphosphate (Ap4A) HIT family hydrolase
MEDTPNLNCRFCLDNKLLIDTPLAFFEHLFVLGSIEVHRPHQAMIVPLRHIETPFELNTAELSELQTAMAFVKDYMRDAEPDGFTLGWNAGAVAGQDVFHAHLHVIARFKGEPSEGLGIHALFRPRAKADA